MGNMYPSTKTWGIFTGCSFSCEYCKPSFQRQVRRVARKIKCLDCYNYYPHAHPERRFRIPSAENVFVAGTGDISFCEPGYVWGCIFWAIENHRPRKPKTYLFQSKAPSCFKQYLPWFKKHQDKVILLTTLETNRDKGYGLISKAPPPSVRFLDFYALDYPRKVLTIEPVMDFDHEQMVHMVLDLKEQGSLLYVWFGYDSKNCGLPEPSVEKAQRLVGALKGYGVEVRGKTLRGVKV